VAAWSSPDEHAPATTNTASAASTVHLRIVAQTGASPTMLALSITRTDGQ
jgi:hypothetical protein